MTTRTVIAAVLTAVSLTLTGCAGESAGGGGDGAGRNVVTVDNRKVDVPGEKPAAIYFFSYTCGECFKGGVEFVKARKQAGDRADFLLVDMDTHETAKEVDAFRARIGGKDVPAVLADKSTLAVDFEVTATSTVVVVGSDGHVAFRAVNPKASEIVDAVGKAADA